MQVHDQKCKESWLLAPGTSFSHHAVLNPATKKLYAVQDKTNLCSWSDHVHDLKKLARKSVRLSEIPFAFPPSYGLAFAPVRLWRDSFYLCGQGIRQPFIAVILQWNSWLVPIGHDTHSNSFHPRPQVCSLPSCKYPIHNLPPLASDHLLSFAPSQSDWIQCSSCVWS